MSLELAKKVMIETRMADRSLFTDDYATTFPDGSVVPVDGLIGTMQAVLAASPDFDFNATNWSEGDGNVSFEIRVSGTMSNALSHPVFGDIPATGKHAVLDTERITITFRDGKVASMTVECDGPCGPPELIRRWTS
jgi:hypothetical protein